MQHIDADLVRPISDRVFTSQDQLLFARLSGDSNPLHMDPLAARRTQAGEPVVHGIHALLWIIESIAKAGIQIHGLQKIEARFIRFMYLYRTTSIELRGNVSSSINVDVIVDKISVLKVLLSFGGRHETRDLGVEPEFCIQDILASPTLEQMKTLGGWLAPPVTSDSFVDIFPYASAALDARRLSGLSQTSRLVGMVCPGKHSLYARLSVTMTEPLPTFDGVRFQTVNVDERTRGVDMVVHGNGISAEISSFARRPPVEAPDMREIAHNVRPDEFAGATALVAGGSRGLGAITAKIIAAGGGEVNMTYSRGLVDAERLCEEINAARGMEACRAISLDVTRPLRPQLELLIGRISHLYYFASPQIFVQKSAVFEPKLFTRFYEYYVNSFYEMCSVLNNGSLEVFYPSSVAVSERPRGLVEYSMAKAAGEMLCEEMNRDRKGLRIFVSRLPRLLTDQTSTIALTKNADPIPVVASFVRAMHGRQGS